MDASAALPGLDLDALTRYLADTRPGFVAGPLSGRVMPGGRSNLTYAVTDGRARWVLRRPPLGHVLETAHDMSREHRVMAALAESPVPVPRMLLLCADPAVLGAPFYLMEFVPGTPYRDPAELERLGPHRVRGLALSLVDTLVALHDVDPAAVGLADLGRPDGYNARQVRRWKRQLDASRSRDVPGIDALHDLLASVTPNPPGGTIVHGDYRLDNVLVTDNDRISAVVDWEMSTLGDPLADLALMLLYTQREAPASSGPPRSPLSVPGHPGIDTLVEHYATGSGRDVSNLQWYLAFAAFKLAVILEGVHYRHIQGKTVGEGFADVGDRVAPLVANGLRTLGSNDGLRA